MTIKDQIKSFIKHYNTGAVVEYILLLIPFILSCLACNIEEVTSKWLYISKMSDWSLVALVLNISCLMHLFRAVNKSETPIQPSTSLVFGSILLFAIINGAVYYSATTSSILNRTMNESLRITQITTFVGSSIIYFIVAGISDRLLAGIPSKSGR